MEGIGEEGQKEIDADNHGHIPGHAEVDIAEEKGVFEIFDGAKIDVAVEAEEKVEDEDPNFPGQQERQEVFEIETFSVGCVVGAAQHEIAS